MDCTWTEAGWFCCFCEDAEHIAELVKAGESWESAVAIVRKQREAAA
jgi:hypothetical protein